MSLQFIFGNSGSGKSSYLYRNILKEAAEHPEKNYLVLVPEQFTMQTQRVSRFQTACFTPRTSIIACAA